VDQPCQSRRGLYISAALWLIAVALLALAIGSLMVSPRQSPDNAALISHPATEPADPPGVKRPAPTVRIYDVHDMIDRWSASPYAQPSVPDMSTSNNQQGNPQRGGGIGAAPATQPSVPDPLMAALVDLISEDIQPDEWLANGGATATIQYCGRRLIIGGSPSLHRDVEKFLRNLRAADANTPIAAGK
jgi:hypothetical protein